jgi:hypothetical protein
MAAGSIVIDLLMRTGAFETDTKRAEARLRALQKQFEAVGTAIGVAIVGGVGAAVYAFKELTGAAGDFKDLEEQTGALAEDLASLAVPAAVAGKSVADLATDMNRLTKNLSGVDDDSKAAGAALAALGIPIADFKKLDPVGQIDALSEAFNGFADGSQKTAVAMALFGKNGAAMLNVFKELQAEGGRQKILTQEQIELADEYGDRQKKLTATIKAYAESAAVDVLPAVNELTQGIKDLAAEFFGIDSAGKKLASESPVKQWAESVVDVLAFAIDAGDGVRRVFQTLGVYIGGTAAVTGAILRGEFGQAKQIAAEARADIDKVLSAESFRDRLGRLRAEAAGAADNQSGAETNRLNRKPALAFNGATKTGSSTDKQSEAERYLETLSKQTLKTQDLSNVELALAEIQSGRLKGLTPLLEKQILAQAKLLDQAKIDKRNRDDQIELETRYSQQVNKRIEDIQKGNVELEKQVFAIGKTKDELAAYELQQTRVTIAEKEAQRARRVADGEEDERLQTLDAEIAALKERASLLGQKQDAETIEAGQKNAQQLGDNYRDTMSESIAEGILDGTRKGLDFTDVFVKELKSQFAKAVLQPIIAPVVRAQNEGISQLLGSITGLFSGNTTDYRGTTLPNSLRGGAATGTNRLERDMITLVHEGEAIVPKAYNPAAGGMGGGNVQVINNLGVQATARTETTTGSDGRQVKRIILDTVAADLGSGTGPTAVAARNRLGTGPGNVPRRG